MAVFEQVWEYNVGKPEDEKLFGHTWDDNIKMCRRGTWNKMKI